MKKSEIKVGEEYLVEVDGLWSRESVPTYQGDVTTPHAFTNTGVSEKYGKQAFARVISVGQPRPKANSYSGAGKYNIIDDGFVVEFLEPYRIPKFGAEETVKTAVLDGRHILKLKSEEDALSAAREKYQREHDEATLLKAEAFEDEIVRVTELLKAAGLNPREVDNRLVFDGGSIRFASTRTSSFELHTDWAFNGLDVKLDTFLALVAGNVTT